MIVVDASIWVSHFIPQDVHHIVSRRWLTVQVNQQIPFILPTLLLSEVSGAISRRTNNVELGHLAVHQILATPHLRLVELTTDVGKLAAQFAADLRLRGADAVYVATAHQYQAALASWDVEQVERAAPLLSTFRPSL